MPRRFATFVAAALVPLALSGGCRAAVFAHGNDPAGAQVNLDALVTGFEYRFTNVTRQSKVNHGRMRIARYAFAPSKLVNDTAIWTAMRTTRTGAEREAEWQAGMVNNQYQFAARHDTPTPARVGDQRHLIAVSQRGEHDWFWHTVVEHHVGTVPPSRLNAVARAFLQSAERPGSAMRVDYRTAFPRTATALGRLLSIDTISAVSQLDGSTVVSMQIRLDARNIAAGFPAYAKYLQQYVEPARYRFRLTDRYGAEWWDMRAVNRVLTVRFRTRNGALQPLAGAARRMPDTLQLTVDALAKLGLFSVGVSNMVGEFVHVDTPRERAWQLRFTKEPKWHLPLIAERLLSAAIRHPFEGQGVYFKLGLHTGPTGQTLSERVVDVAVQESAIMRWLGNLGFTAMSDFAGKVEEEENRFLIELFRAMRSDMEALVRTS
ncbi:MAG: hypothetical protein ACK5AK_03445 [Gemmatimonas sp.]|jgi:hypothetical protein